VAGVDLQIDAALGIAQQASELIALRSRRVTRHAHKEIEITVRMQHWQTTG
jgi:hypothetical protein